MKSSTPTTCMICWSRIKERRHCLNRNTSVLGFRSLIKQVIVQGWRDEAPRMSAALAFYTVFSLAPILIVAIAIAGLVFGQKMALDQVIDQIQQLIGRQGAETV